MSMKLLYLLLCLGMTSAMGKFIFSETENHNPDSASFLSQQIDNNANNIERLQRDFDNKFELFKKHFDTKIENLENICQEEIIIETDISEISDTDDEKVQVLVEQFVDQMLRFSETAVSSVKDAMEKSLNDTLAKLEIKMQPVQDDLDLLKVTMSRLVTQDEMVDLQKKVIDQGKDVKQQIIHNMKALPTEIEMEAHNGQLGKQLQEISTILGNMSVCNDPTVVENVLKNLEKSNTDMEEMNNAAKDNFKCQMNFNEINEILESLSTTTKDNNQSISVVENKVNEMQNEYNTRLEELETLAESIKEEPIQEALSTDITTEPATITTSTREPSACLDSAFQGVGRSLNLCKSAVRFGKCQIEFVAFHCCRSCWEAGQLTTIPADRGVRVVPVMKALALFKP